MSDALTPQPENDPRYSRIPSSDSIEFDFLARSILRLESKVDRIAESEARHSAQINNTHQDIVDLRAKVDKKVENLEKVTGHLPIVKHSLLAIAVSACAAVGGGVLKMIGVIP